MASLMAYAFNQYFDDDGAPLSGGKVYAYVAGTSLATPKDTFTTSAGTTANANPVILDANGRADIYLEEGSYDFVIKDSDDVEVEQKLNVPGATGSGVTSLQTVETVSELKGLSSGGSTYVDVGGYSANGDGGGGRFYWDSTSTASDNTGTIITPNSGPGTGRWIRITDKGPINVKWFGVTGDGSTNDAAAIALANTYADSLGNDAALYFPAADTYYNCGSTAVTLTVPAIIDKGGLINGTGALTFLEIRAGLYQIFTNNAASNAVLTSGYIGKVFAEWFGAIGDNSTDCTTPLNNAEAVIEAAGGGSLYFSTGTYLVSGSVTFGTASAPVRVVMDDGAIFTAASSQTLTINAFQGSSSKHFDTNITVVFGFGAVEAVNPIWWGADPSGTNDSQTAIQAAIDCAVASAGSYIRKVYLPEGFYDISDELTIDRNAIWIQGAGRQATFIQQEFETTLSFASSGYTSAVESDVGKTVTSESTILEINNGSTDAVASDIGKTVTDGTATGVLVRFLNSLAGKFWEVSNVSGTFSSSASLTISGGTGTGTLNKDGYTRTNTGTLQSYDNTARTWSIKGTAGAFWDSMSVTISTGTGSGTLSADGSSPASSINITTGVTKREFCRISDIGFQAANFSPAWAIDCNSSPNTTLSDIFIGPKHWGGIKGGDNWNTQVSNVFMDDIEYHCVRWSSNGNDTSFVNVSLIGKDRVGSRGYYFESCYSVSVNGGTVEDVEWAVELLATNLSFDGYLESVKYGGFASTGNNTNLHVVNANFQNAGSKAMFYAPASVTKILASSLRLANTSSTFVFDLTGSAEAHYGIIYTDDNDYAAGGAKFEQTAGASKVRDFLYNADFIDTVTITDISADFALEVVNSSDKGIKISAGNNKVNDDSEPVLLLAAADDTEILQVESGGRLKLSGYVGDNLGIGVAKDASTIIAIGSDIENLAGANQWGIFNTPEFSSAASGVGTALYVQLKKASAYAQTFSRGIEIASPDNPGSSGTLWGLYIRDQSGGGTNYAIETEAGQVKFGDDVEIVGDLQLSTAGAGIEYESGGPKDLAGSGTPESAVTAPVGSTFRRSDGGASTSFYVKESGTGNTGWVAK